jgi:NADPH:quinone reductase-like Zn-dependent oxidoreductase
VISDRSTLRRIRGIEASYMRQVWITKAGAPEVLQVREAPDPEAAAGQVRVRVRAAGINFADLMARTGMYPDAPKIPCVIGYEVSGTVDQVGQGVTGLNAGDRVFAMPYFGGYSDTVVVPAAQAIAMPAKMSFEEAAALPVVYITAHHAMLFTGNLRPGMKVLIHSAAGGVGLAAVQLARAHQCEIFGTASAGKLDFLRGEGVQHPIDTTTDAAAAVRAIVGDAGVDLVLDPVGGASWQAGYDLLGPTGRLVAFGFSAASGGNTRNLWKAVGAFLQVKKYSPMKLMGDNRSLTGINMAHLFNRADLLRPQFEALLKLYDEGVIKPHVDRTFRFDEAPAAHQYLHDRKARGKVLLVP